MFQKQLKQGQYETNNVRKENTKWEKEQRKIMDNEEAERGMEDMKMEIV